MRRALALLLAGVLSAGCFGPWRRTETAGDRVLPVRLPEPAYEELFPYYAELCALSQFERIGVVKGGNAGHGVLYLKGVCRDEDAAFPTLKMCPEVVNDLNDPHHGVGISANERLKNVNWIAYPGRQLFFNGNLKRGQTLTQKHFDATARYLVESGLLRGVEVHEELLPKSPGRAAQDVFAEYLLGSDVAIRFARSVFCSTLPLKREQMERVVGYLNERNRHYATETRPISGASTTTTASTSCAMPWPPPPSGRRVPWTRGRCVQFFNMSVPANAAVNLATRANLFPLEDFGAVHGDARDARLVARLRLAADAPRRAAEDRPDPHPQRALQHQPQPLRRPGRLQEPRPRTSS